MTPGQNYGLMSAPQAQPMAMGAMAPPPVGPGPALGAMGAPDSTAQLIIAHLLQQGLQMPQGQPMAAQPVAGQPQQPGSRISLTPQMIQQIMQQRAQQPQQPQAPTTGPGAGLADVQQAQHMLGIAGR